MLALIARINYAFARGMLYGQASSLFAAIPVALFLLIDSGRWRAEYWLGLQAIIVAIAGGSVAAIFLGLFMPHDPHRKDLQLGKKCRTLSISAAVTGIFAIFIFHISGYDTTHFLPQANWQELIEFIRSRPKLVISALGISLLAGAVVRPPHVLMLLALNYFTFWDVLRGGNPHHDEEEASDLPASEHGQLHADAAVWWAYRGQAPRARFEWAEARRLGGMTAEGYQECASFYVAVSDLSEAEKIIGEGLKQFHDNVDLLYAMTDVLEMQNLPGEAESAYRKILSLAPTHGRALHAYGNILYGQGRLDEAMHHFDRAVESAVPSDDNLVRFLNSRGAALATLGKLEDAKEDFTRAIQLGNQIYLVTRVAPDGLRDAVRNLGTLHGLRRRLGTSPEEHHDRSRGARS